jgi:uncharacterized protein (TIGR03435 family)
VKFRRTLIEMLFLTASSGLCQQKPDTARLEFDVASIKPAPPGAAGGAIKPLPGGQTYIAQNAPVKLIIELMYHLNRRQVSGGPPWLDAELYDIEAKSERPRSIDDLHIMFQNLLVDRFKLQFHDESRVLPAYELVVDKSGPKLEENNSPIQPLGRGRFQATHCSMSYFSWVLSQMLDRPVLDQTGLSQHYNFKLEWTPEPPPDAGIRGGAGAAPPPRELPPANGPDVFTALREELGLKLESRKGPVEVMVIDHIERPSAN